MLLLTCKAFTQTAIIKGKTVDAKTGEYVSFTNIGIQNESIGTVSNENGDFILKIYSNIDVNKEVIFSHLGYADRIITLKALLEKKEETIKLESIVNQLAEVKVSLKKPKPKKIGRTAKGLGMMHRNYYSVTEKEIDDRLSKEIGMKLSIKKDCSIEDLNFNISTNDFKDLKFRVNFYSIKNNLPDTLLVQKEIILEIKDGYLGWFKFDLKQFDISIDKENENIAVTLQWIHSQKMDNKKGLFSISAGVSPLSTSFYRSKVLDVWKKDDTNLSLYLNAMCN